jgi:glycerate 2-kinase
VLSGPAAVARGEDGAADGRDQAAGNGEQDGRVEVLVGEEQRKRYGNGDTEDGRGQEPDVARGHGPTVGEIPDPARVVVAPGPLKGVLSAAAAARALARGLASTGAVVDDAPMADGGEGTAAALRAALGGEWRAAWVSDPLGRQVEARFAVLSDGRAVVEAAEAIGLARLAPDQLDAMRASSRGLGELIGAALDAGAAELVIGLGDTATVDGGAGLREIVASLPADTVVACDVANPLLGPRGAAHAFGPQKGASPAEVAELERRLAAEAALAPFAEIPGAGAAGGLGAALAALGANLVPGAELVAKTIGLRERLSGAALAVTGEGTVDYASREGKVTGVVVALASEAGARCVVFGGRVESGLPRAETIALGGDPSRAEADLEELGEQLGREL